MTAKRILLMTLLLLLPLSVFAQSADEELIAAAKKGDVVAVKAALAKGAKVNARTNYGATPLHFAADRGHLEVIRALVEAGADTNAKDDFYKMTPIAMALTHGKKEAVELLQKISVEKKNAELAAKSSAAASASQPAQTNQPAKPAVNPKFNEELIKAAKRGDVTTVKELLAKGADVNAKTEYGATPLFFACDRGNAEIVKLLLAAGADTDVRDTFYKSTPISWAVQRDQAEVVKLLVEKKPASKEPTTAMAVNMEQVKTVETLLALGDFKPESLTLWLTIAEKNGNTEIVEALKKAGAKPKPKIDFKVEEATLKLYEGVYKNERFEFKFSVKDGKLNLSTTDGFESLLVPAAQHIFEVDKVVGATVTFAAEGNNITGLTWKNAGSELILKKETK